MHPARKLALSTAVFLLVLLGLEAGLRIGGFRHESVVQFGWPQPDQLARFVPDPDYAGSATFTFRCTSSPG